MLNLFGRKPERSAEDIVREPKSHVVQLREAMGISYLAIAPPMLSFGMSLLAKDRGLAVMQRTFRWSGLSARHSGIQGTIAGPNKSAGD